MTSAAHALLTTGSLAAGDGLTPFVCRSIEDDKVRHRESAAAFLKLVCDDEIYGDANRPLITTWAEELLPRAYTAAQRLLGDDVPTEDALAEALHWITEEFNEVGIDLTAVELKEKELSA